MAVRAPDGGFDGHAADPEVRSAGKEDACATPWAGFKDALHTNNPARSPNEIVEAVLS